MSQATDEQMILDAARERGSELLGHLGIALLDRDIPAGHIASHIRTMDINGWWDTWGGPALDALATDVADSATVPF